MKEIMTIQEIYDKYKHFDELLSDRMWLALDEEGNHIHQILYDLWQAIKKEVEESKT